MGCSPRLSEASLDGDALGSLHAAIARAALDTYLTLPKSGKPQQHEHTVLAAIVITAPHLHSLGDSQDRCHGPTADAKDQPMEGKAAHPRTNAVNIFNPIVVALATGTKCLPGSKRADDGSALHDCHAEVLCRRAFMRWMYSEIKAVISASVSDETPEDLHLNASLVFRKKTSAKRCFEGPLTAVGHVDDSSDTESIDISCVELLPGVCFHMFVSRLPCGDASVLNLDGADALGRTGAKPLKRSLDGTAGCSQTMHHQPMRRRVNDKAIERPSSPSRDVAWTQVVTQAEGAAAVRTCGTTMQYIPIAADVESYDVPQDVGVVRRKPGKGEPTMSMSCSDKLMKWSVLGVQGTLLGALLLEPVHVSSVTVLVDDPNTGQDGEYDSSLSNKLLIASLSALQRSCFDRVRDLSNMVPGIGGDSSPLHLGAIPTPKQRMHELGLSNGDERRVPSGACITWWAHATMLWKKKSTATTADTRIGMPLQGSDGRCTVHCIEMDPSKNSTVSKTSVVVRDRICISHATAPHPVSWRRVRGTLEVVTGFTGAKQGTARRGAECVSLGARSSLSRAALLEEFFSLARLAGVQLERGGMEAEAKTAEEYAKLKALINSKYVRLWRYLLDNTPQFEGWIRK